MLIKLYNGLNRFAPSPRLNFRYFSWVPDRRPQSGYHHGGSTPVFRSLSLRLASASAPLCLIRGPLFFARKSIDPAGRGTRTSGRYRCRTRRQVRRICKRTFVNVATLHFTTRSPIVGVFYPIPSE